MDCTVKSALSSREFETLKSKSGYAYHGRELRNRIGQILEAGEYDVVFLQKAIATIYVRGLDRLLRGRAGRLVYDIDDAVHVSPPVSLRAPWSMLESRPQVKRIMAQADLVLAGNAWLRDEAALVAGKKAVLFPTVVDTKRFCPGDKRDDVYRVGWMGNPSTAAHLKVAVNALRQLENSETVLIGAGNPVQGLESAIRREWSLENEVDALQQMGVGIMPLKKDEWTRGKCALKALQYMACGVPCVATPYGAALDIIEHGKNGLFADSDAEWREALDALRDDSYRNALGDAGRRTVEEHYSLDTGAPKLAALLEGLV